MHGQSNDTLLLSCFSKGRQSEDGPNVTVSPRLSTAQRKLQEKISPLMETLKTSGSLSFTYPSINIFPTLFFLPFIELKILETVPTGGFVIFQCVLSQMWSAVKLSLVLPVKICCAKQ